MTEKINNSSNTYVRKVDKVKITSADNVTICITNHIIDVTVTRKRNTKGFSDIVKIDKDHYVVKNTGEIKEYAHVEKSQEMIASNRRKSMNKKFSYLRQYINMNFKGEDCERHITLTYAEPTEDMAKCKNNFKKFWKRFLYRYGEMEYIAVFEPHQKGTWHIHVLVKKDSVQRLKLLKNEVEKIWGNGYIRISDFRNHNDIGLYFCNLLGEDISKDKKKKSSRLEYYPLHAKIYTSSKGLAKPTLLHIGDEELKEIVRNRKPCFEQGYSIRMCDTDHEVNRIGRITYNDKVNPYNE